MVNTIVLEGWIDNDITIREKPNNKGRYGIATLAYVIGNGEYLKRNKTTIFLEDGFSHKVLTTAEAMKIHKQSRVVITGVLRDPAEEKQADGTWKKPAGCSIAVTSIAYASVGSKKEDAKETAGKSESTDAAAAEYGPATPPAEDYETLELTDENDLPF